MEEKLIKLYDYIIENYNGAITTKELKNLGFNSHSIKTLVDNNILARTKRGFYNFLAILELQKYGIDNISDLDACEKILFKCLELNPKFISAYYYLFEVNIKRNNYDEAFKNFAMFYHTTDRSYQADHNLILFLFSMIYDLPDKYYLLAQELTLSDLLVSQDDPRFSDCRYENFIRTKIWELEFKYAKTLIYKQEKLMSINILTLILIKLIPKLEIKSPLLSYSELIKQGLFSELKTRLIETNSTKQSRKDLLTLVNDYLTIKETRIIPEVPTESKDYSSAFKDYETALNFKIRLFQDKENEILLMLSKIVELINTIKSEQEEAEKNKINIIHNLLLNGNHNMAFKEIHDYLAKHELSKYEFLIISLIKISLLEKDDTFRRPIHVLKSLINNSFNFNALQYRKDFYDSLEGDYEKEAEAYLAIIKYMATIYYLPFNTNNLDIDLYHYKNKKKKEYLISLIDTVKDKVLDDKTAIILKNLSSQEKKQLSDTLSAYPNIVYYDFKDKFFIKYYEYTYLDFANLTRVARNNYEAQNYKACLNTCFEILISSKNTKDYIISLIGECYYKLGNLDLALDYMEIAYYLNATPYYKNLIASIKRKQKEETFVPFTLSDFRINNFTNIPEVKEALKLILIDNLSLNEVISSSNLDTYSKNILKLFLTREYFILGNTSYAEALLKEVEKSPDKTRDLILIIKELRQNIKFYANQDSKLIRTLE